MRKIIVFIFAIAVCSFSLQLKAQQQEIKFLSITKWADALAIAKAQNKPIFLDAYTTWCGPCRKMDAEVYTDAYVAKYFNDHFISVKIQMDSTKNDDERTKAMWTDAKRLTKQYKIDAFPSFLFFDANGNIIHREVGYKNIAEFLAVGRSAIDPQNQFYAQVAQFRKGQFDYASLYGLEKQARKFRNNKLADSIALKLYSGHINKMPKEKLMTQQNLDFISAHIFSTFFTSKDLIFKLALQQPQELNSVKKLDTKLLVNNVISREEIDNKVWNGSEIINKAPDWPKFISNIKSKYQYDKADSLVMIKQIDFYAATSQPALAAKTRTALVAAFPPVKDFPDVFYALNAPAWGLFLTATDPLLLNEALSWSELSMKLGNSDQYIDTRANLLYKLGRKDEAIDMETKALEFAISQARKTGKPVSQEGAFKEYFETIRKMLKGEPTWPTK